MEKKILFRLLGSPDEIPGLPYWDSSKSYALQVPPTSQTLIGSGRNIVNAVNVPTLSRSVCEELEFCLFALSCLRNEIPLIALKKDLKY